jgi:hypothetical protein
MRKTDKKVDNQLRIALTEVCDTALKEFTGFQWLTHLVNYDSFAKTLRVVCIFDTNENLSQFMATKSNLEMSALIQTGLVEIGIDLKNIANHISYDTEENCEKNHNGKWVDRLGV